MKIPSTPFRRRIPGIIALFMIILTLALAASCSKQPEQAKEAGKPAVVATFSILADWVKAIGGERIEVISLVGPDQDSHAWEPSPRDQIVLGKATMIFAIGLEFETWLEKLVTASGTKAPVVEVSEGLDLIKVEHEGEEENHEEDAEEHAEEGEDHHHGEYDPHIWHSVTNARLAVKLIASKLTELDPPGAGYYSDRLAAYLATLDDLDGWVRAQVASLPENQRILVTNHDTFGYLARDYGFTLLTSAFQGISTQGAEPSAKNRAALTETLRSSGVKAVFAENMSNTKVLEQAAAEAGVKIAPVLYTDALGPEGSPAADYTGLMRYNILTMHQALSGDK